MSNICFKITLEKNWPFQNFDFANLKNCSPGQFLGSSNSRRYHWMSKLLVATYKLEVWEQKGVWVFYYFNFERIYDVSKSKSPCIEKSKFHEQFQKDKMF